MTEIEKVRLRIGDTTSAIFTDAQIQEFLDANDDSVLLACADACMAVATSAALQAKFEVLGSHTLDRRGIASAYSALADKYFTQAQTEPAWSVAEQSLSDFSASEIIENEAMRED